MTPTMDSTRIHYRRDLPLHTFHGLTSGSARMMELFRLIEKVARSSATVLIRGETGTGKELVARAIHALSGRSRHPFMAINCATLTPDLLASELFGHVRGAFTGAIAHRTGLFAAADNGTVFLDEIAEMPLDIQARLLRVLQERSFVPVGGTESVSVDVRVLSATNKALRDEVEAHRFREDLMYRVRVVPLFIPPLAEREGDVEALTWTFIEHFNAQGTRQIEGITQRAFEALMGYSWPGNVRELRNVVEYAHVVGEGPYIQLSDFPPELRGEPSTPTTSEEPERFRLEQALREARGKRAKAARALGMSRTTLWRKLREHGLVSRCSH